jgi:hypothetical protein
MACAFKSAGTPPGKPSGYCRIIIANDDLLHDRVKALGFWDFEIILRHEIGHCNGWDGDHKGARHAEAEPGRSPTWRKQESALPMMELSKDSENERIRQRDQRATELYSTYQEVANFWSRGR